MADIISISRKRAPQQDTPVATALSDILEAHPGVTKGLVIVWDEKAKDWRLWVSVTQEEMAWLSLQLGHVALE